MRIDKPSLVLGILILIVSALFVAGGISRDAAQNAFIILPMLGFLWARREACKLECEA